MLIELILFAAFCIVLGITIGLFLARPVIIKKMLEVEAHWKEKLALINNNWTVFYNSKVDDWLSQTRGLVNKTIEERDRAWEKKLSGTKSKPKPSN